MSDSLTVTCRKCKDAYDEADISAFSMHHTGRCLAVMLDSLRRDLAVTRAALAQCTTVLESARQHINNIDRGHPDTEPLIAEIVAVLSNPDVEHAVRVEAARDAVIQAANSAYAVLASEDGLPNNARVEVARGMLGRSTMELDALTSEHKP